MRKDLLYTRMDNIYRPGECMKYMNVEMHPALHASWYCADVNTEVTATGARVVTSSDIFDPALVLWSRNIPPALAKNNELVQLTSKEPCDVALYVMMAEGVAEHVHARTLAQHISRIKEIVGKTLTLVIFGVNNHFKAGRKTQNSNQNPMTQIDLEMARTDLLVSAECDTVLLNTSSELARVIVQFTKAIAEAPHKKAKHAQDEAVDFYMRGDNKNCIAIDKNGGLSRLWQQMVAVLPMSSLETARTLCAQYKTPRALYEALQQPDEVNRIANMGVARAGGPDVRARRIGLEFARKLQVLFTAEDGDTVLD